MPTGYTVVIKNGSGNPLIGIPVVPVNTATGAEGTAVNTDSQGLAAFTGLTDAVYGFRIRAVRHSDATIEIINYIHDHSANDEGGLVAAGSIDHGGLAGLADDDHPQYATDTDLTTHEGDTSTHGVAQVAGMADIATHTALTDAHHAQAHTLTSHSTRAHSELTGVGTDDHHAKSHAHDGADGSGTVAHSATTGKTANDHHNQSHVLATNTALGTDHTMSGATSGHVLRASSATAAAFAQLSHADLGSVTADQHHAQSHTHASHTSIGANDHHNQSHSGTDHSDYTAPTTWSPSYTNITTTDGTITPRYEKIGKRVFGSFTMVFGAGSDITGTAGISPPVTASSSLAAGTPIGSAMAWDTSASTMYILIARLITTTRIEFEWGSVNEKVNATQPFDWASGDQLFFEFQYEAA